MMMTQQRQTNCQNTLNSLCQLANRMINSPKQHEQLLREYINIYIQNKKRSQDFFIYFCEHNILHKLFTVTKYLRSLTALQLFNLLLCNTNQPNDLIYIFSQPIVHQYLFEKVNLYGQDAETIEYFVQLIKTIIMKASCPENQYLIKLFCNKRFSSFPLLTSVTILGVRKEAEQMVKITAQQCVLLLINLINTKKTGLVYLNELQIVIFFHELTSQMLDFQQNNDEQGSIKYLIDLIITLKDNKMSLCLLMNALTNNLFFKQKRQPVEILRFLFNIRQISIQYKQIKEQIMENIIRIFYRIFCKLYCGKFINFTYYSAQHIIPNLSINVQPKILKFIQDRSKSIEEYLVNQEDYSKNQRDIDLIFQLWVQFNNKAVNSPTKKSVSKSKVIKQFFSHTDSTVERYIEAVMTSAGLDMQKINTPIIKLTFSSNFRTSVFLVQKVLMEHEGSKSSDFYEQFCKEEDWKLTPSVQFFSICYQIYLMISQKREKSSILLQQLEPQEQFLEKIYPKIAKLVTEQLISNKFRACKPYLLLLYKLINKMSLRQQLQAYLIEHLLKKLYDLQKLLAQMIFNDQNFPSFLKYAIRNEKRPFFRDSLQVKTIESQLQEESKKQLKLQHYLIYYELIKNYLDSSIKSLNEFLKQYWEIKLAVSQKNKKSYKSLAVYRDALGNYLQIYPNEYYEFQVRHFKSQTEPIAKFKISQKDFREQNINSSELKTQQYGRLHFTDSKKAKDFVNDVKSLRLKRQEIFRMAILQYMPFIYESIQIKYRQRSGDLDTTPY